MTLSAYHGKQKTKDAYVRRIQRHINADNLVHGYRLEPGRGCSVACILNNHDHTYSEVESEIGIPRWSAVLLDMLYENCSNDVWPTIAIDFLNAVDPGQDLSLISNNLKIFILNANIARVENLNISDNRKNSVLQYIDQYRQRDIDDQSSLISSLFSILSTIDRLPESVSIHTALSVGLTEKLAVGLAAEFDEIAIEFLRLVSNN